MVKGNYLINNLFCMLFFGFGLQISAQIVKGQTKSLQFHPIGLSAKPNRTASAISTVKIGEKTEWIIHKNPLKNTYLSLHKSKITDTVMTGGSRGSKNSRSEPSFNSKASTLAPRSIIGSTINQSKNFTGFITEDTVFCFSWEITSSNQSLLFPAEAIADVL